MDVNYLTEVNGLDDWEFGNPLSATAYKVMRKLLMIANRQRFPERIPIANNRLCFLVGCTEKSLIAARQQLIQRGLIEYKGKKKQTPVYTIHYFSHNPRYNWKNSSIDGSINWGIDGSIGGGIDGSMDGGTSINNTNGPTDGLDGEGDFEKDDAPEEERTMVHASLHHPSPTQPLAGVQGRGGRFAPRQRKLAPDEIWAYATCKTILENEDMRQLYGNGWNTMRQIVESDAYPLALVLHAIDKTAQRNRMYPSPLGNPAAYSIKLLDSWQREGFETVEDVQESKDDWMHYG